MERRDKENFLGEALQLGEEVQSLGLILGPPRRRRVLPRHEILVQLGDGEQKSASRKLHRGNASLSGRSAPAAISEDACGTQKPRQEQAQPFRREGPGFGADSAPHLLVQEVLPGVSPEGIPWFEFHRRREGKREELGGRGRFPDQNFHPIGQPWHGQHKVQLGELVPDHQVPLSRGKRGIHFQPPVHEADRVRRHVGLAYLEIRGRPRQGVSPYDPFLRRVEGPVPVMAELEDIRHRPTILVPLQKEVPDGKWNLRSPRRNGDGVVGLDQVERVQLNRIRDRRSEVEKTAVLDGREEDLGTGGMVGHMGKANLERAVTSDANAVDFSGGFGRDLVEYHEPFGERGIPDPYLPAKDGDHLFLGAGLAKEEKDEAKGEEEAPLGWKRAHGQVRG